MPLVPVPIVMEHGATYKTWRLFRHLNCVAPLSYVFTDKDHFHAHIEDQDTYVITFPNLGEVFIHADGSIVPSAGPFGALHTDDARAARDACLSGGAYVRQFLHGLIEAAVTLALYRYVLRGQGSLDAELVRRFTGSTISKLNALLANAGQGLPVITGRRL